MKNMLNKLALMLCIAAGAQNAQAIEINVQELFATAHCDIAAKGLLGFAIGAGLYRDSKNLLDNLYTYVKPGYSDVYQPDSTCVRRAKVAAGVIISGLMGAILVNTTFANQIFSLFTTAFDDLIKNGRPHDILIKSDNSVYDLGTNVGTIVNNGPAVIQKSYN